MEKDLASRLQRIKEIESGMPQKAGSAANGGRVARSHGGRQLTARSSTTFRCSSFNLTHECTLSSVELLEMAMEKMQKPVVFGYGFQVTTSHEYGQPVPCFQPG